MRPAQLVRAGDPMRGKMTDWRPAEAPRALGKQAPGGQKAKPRLIGRGSVVRAARLRHRGVGP